MTARFFAGVVFVYLIAKSMTEPLSQLIVLNVKKMMEDKII